MKLQILKAQFRSKTWMPPTTKKANSVAKVVQFTDYFQTTARCHVKILCELRWSSLEPAMENPYFWIDTQRRFLQNRQAGGGILSFVCCFGYVYNRQL